MATSKSESGASQTWQHHDTEGIPPLQAGEQLSRAEFERRYHAMPHLKKAELLEGVVIMPSPVHDIHARPHALVVAWLSAYRVATPVDLLIEVTVRLDEANEPQPDALLRIPPEAGGRSRISADNYIEGAPELVVEVAVSSTTHDLREKQHVYCRCGVQEYVVWEVQRNTLHWFQRQQGTYVPLLPGDDGIMRSVVFPGLHLHPAALLTYDWQATVDAVQQGVHTPEHRAFVARLQQP
jgi:Uma2 family endonuclease